MMALGEGDSTVSRASVGDKRLGDRIICGSDVITRES